MTHAAEVASGRRFEFGKNWSSFLTTVDDARVHEAEKSLQAMLGRPTLAGLRFLDIGCGSGLFSLAAARLGATVHSFDFDPESVASTTELRARFAEHAPWTIEEGSVLDGSYVASLGTFDVVYSWGVLHHTGEMWSALDNAAIPLAKPGQLFIAIYNDQGVRSRLWTIVKRAYCASRAGRSVVTAAFFPLFAVRAVLSGLVKHGDPTATFRAYRSSRGMSVVHDWVDWLGGYPFEVASVDEICNHFATTGLQLSRVVQTDGWGCNQFVFETVREK